METKMESETKISIKKFLNSRPLRDTIILGLGYAKIGTESDWEIIDQEIIPVFEQKLSDIGDDETRDSKYDLPVRFLVDRDSDVQSYGAVLTASLFRIEKYSSETHQRLIENLQDIVNDDKKGTFSRFRASIALIEAEMNRVVDEPSLKLDLATLYMNLAYAVVGKDHLTEIAEPYMNFIEKYPVY
ncbi:MAG: hypothetical protein GOU99_03680 [Candidatus Altiarchaeota archaeon]|nr:hypothetical protein [Candidatus Altiarchaeota archaeon]